MAKYAHRVPVSFFHRLIALFPHYKILVEFINVSVFLFRSLQECRLQQTRKCELRNKICERNVSKQPFKINDTEMCDGEIDCIE